MCWHGQQFIAGLIFRGVRRIDDEVLFVLQHRLIVLHVEQGQAFACRRIARHGLVAKIKR